MSGCRRGFGGILHELFPGLVVASRSLRRGPVFTDLDERLAGVDSTVARVAKELVSDIRALTQRVNALER